jgi:hypothetical protein
MFNKIMKSLVRALVLSGIFIGAVVHAQAAPRGWSTADHYGLSYSNTARHDPRDTNGFSQAATAGNAAPGLRLGPSSFASTSESVVRPFGPPPAK